MRRRDSSCYTADVELERTPLGAVLKRPKGKLARIYVNGLRVATEDDFLFSSDVTSTSAALRRALNRERAKVGRTAYADGGKAILLATQSKDVADALPADLALYEWGTIHDETEWLDLGLHACTLLRTRRRATGVSFPDGRRRPSHGPGPRWEVTRYPRWLRALNIPSRYRLRAGGRAGEPSPILAVPDKGSP
jgi:hypothetical protein